MTTEEAIKLLKAEWYQHMSTETGHAILKGMEALEKHVPRAPITDAHDVCGRCGKIIEGTPSHCSNCGQALLWDSTEVDFGCGEDGCEIDWESDNQ